MSERSFRRANRRRERAARRRRVGVGAAAAGAALVIASPASAATYTVNSTADPGVGGCDMTECTLREAVASANASTTEADEINFDLGAGPQVIGLNSYDLEIEGASGLSINGTGSDTLTIDAEAEAGFEGFTGDARVFEVLNAVTVDVSISGMTLTGGKAGTYDPSGPTYTNGAGGGIRAANSNLVLDDVTVSGNTASGAGGGVYLSSGSLTATDSTFASNTTYFRGGGVYVAGAGELTMTDPTITGNEGRAPNFGFSTIGAPAGGGIYASAGDISISGAEISGNEAISGATGHTGGISLNGTGEITDSTVSDNEARRVGGIFMNGPLTAERLEVTGNYAANIAGGVLLSDRADLVGSTVYDNGADGRGGGVVFKGASTRVINSTISGNIAGTGGGLASYDSDDELQLRSSTVTGNSADIGGAIAAFPSDTPNVIIRSSILANSIEIGAGSLPDLSSDDPGAPFDVGFSLVEDPGTGLVIESPSGSNIFGEDPALGPIAANGGPTETHLPAPTSPVIDAALAGSLTTDQRGAGFPRTVDAAAPNEPLTDGTDMGAVEVQSASATGDDDVTPPDTEITSGPTGSGNPASVSISFTSPDSGATFECSLDGAPFSACTSPRTLSGLAVGPHSFEVRAKDAEGNVDPTPATRLFNVGFPQGADATAPQTLITSVPTKLQAKSKRKPAKAKVLFEGLDDRAGTLTFECKIDKAAFAPCTSPASLKLKKGKHTIAVRAIDAAGNADASPDTATVKVTVKKPKK